jgi:REP element-mobilizing transposase RayT
MPRRTVDLCGGEHYHFHNRGVNREWCFFERDNYLFYLKRVREYLLPVLDVVAYCLMPNHYHLLVGLRGFGRDDALGCILYQGHKQAVQSCRRPVSGAVSGHSGRE